MELNRLQSAKVVGYGPESEPIYGYVFEDAKTGDLYESISAGTNYDSEGMVSSYDYQPGKLIATGEALKNPDIQSLTNNYNWRGIVNPGEKYSDPTEAQRFYDLKQTNPDQYYKQLATDVSDQILGNWSMNKGEHNAALTNQLEKIKEVNQPAYYQGQLNLLSKQVGWQHGQNSIERAAGTQEKIQSLVPEALKAGLTPEQIQSIYGSSFSAASAQNQTRIANDKAGTGGGFNLGEIVRGIIPVAALAIGGPLISAAGAAGAGAAGAGAAGGTAAAGSGLSAAELLAVGGFAPTAGSGASFVVPSLLGGAGAAGSGLSAAELLATGGFSPTAGSAASFTVPSAVASGAGGSLLGPTYAELGYTGLVDGLAGPTYGELGLTGLELGTEASAGAPIYDYSQEVILSPSGNYIPANTLPSEIAGLDAEIVKAGQAAIKAAPSTLSPLQAVSGLRGVSGLLGGGQQQPTQPSARQQNVMPRGQVDYSGILNLLQARSPQRNPYSLLG